MNRPGPKAWGTPAPDSSTEKAPAQGSRPALPYGRLFERRLTPGFQGQAPVQPRSLADKAEFNDLMYRPKSSLEKEGYRLRGFAQNVVMPQGTSAQPASANHQAASPYKSPSEASKNLTTAQPIESNIKTTPPPPANKVRLLTDGEKQLVRSIFGDAIQDLDKVEIHHHSFIPFLTAPWTMAPNGSIYLGRSLRHIQDFSKSWWDQHIKLIHEMVHVWQRQNGMHVMARRILKPFATYDYVLEPGKPFHKYTMEQQATIVEDYFRSLHGVTAVKNNEKEDASSILPPSMRR